jgi:hypothetical protein
MCKLGSSNIGQLFDCATGFISSSFIPLVFTIATVFFVWGVVKFFIINADEEAKRTQGKQFMIWSIIAFVAISSIWGIVKIMTSTLGTNSGFVIPGVKPK